MGKEEKWGDQRNNGNLLKWEDSLEAAAHD